MATIFTEIIKGELPSYKVAETDKFYAFLDIEPNTKGHTLCVPKQEVDRIWDLDENTYMELMAFSRKVALAIEKTIACDRVGLAVVGLEVPHAHVHLIPLHEMKDIDFKQITDLSEEEFKVTAQTIGENFKNI